MKEQDPKLVAPLFVPCSQMSVADGKTGLSLLGRPRVGLEYRHLWCAAYPGSIDAFRREPFLFFLKPTRLSVAAAKLHDEPKQY